MNRNKLKANNRTKRDGQETRSFRLHQRRVRWSALAGTTALLALGTLGTARAQDISVTINGQPVQFQDIGPQQIQGRTLVPVRGVLEKLGATISFEARTQTVIASTPNIDIQLKIGSKIAVVNGKNITLDIPAQTIHDHTFVPLRFIGEALGADLSWDAPTRTVRILTKDALNAGGGHAAPPANPPTPKPQPAPGPNVMPVLNSFAIEAKGWLHAGETLRTVMEGTPGGVAAFRIPGLGHDILMPEKSPGHYVGEWQVPADHPLQLKAAGVLGGLRIGTVLAPLVQAGQLLSVDTLPPRIRDNAPEVNANVNDPRPNISAVFEDEGSGIDRKAIHLFVDGQEVTADATVTRDFISYRPANPMPAGTRQIQLVVMDVAGNKVESRWTFNEQSQAQTGIKSVSDNVKGVLEPGDTLHAEMTGTPGGKAAFSVGSIQNVPMREDQPGHYVRDYTIRKGDDVASKPIAFRLLMPNGQKFEQASQRAVRVSTGKPTAPTITSPALNAAPANPLVVQGKAMPNSKVHVKVSYRNKVLGVFALQGNAADVVVTADKNGSWQTEPINLGGLFGNKGVEYTISATAVNAADEQSDTTTTKFRVN